MYDACTNILDISPIVDRHNEYNFWNSNKCKIGYTPRVQDFYKIFCKSTVFVFISNSELMLFLINS